MRKVLVAAVAAFVSTSSSQAFDAQPSLNQSRDVPVGAFERVDISGPFKVAVFISAAPAKVRLSGPPALLADAIAKVDGDTLTIRFREGATWSWNPGSGVNVLVTAPKLVSARVGGAAQVEIGGARGETFFAATNGSGTVVLRGLDAGQVLLATGGAGAITAEGRARKGAYAVGGPGSIDAKRLRVETASIAVGGAGSIYADVSGAADVAVGGSGRVEVVGGATCTKKPVSSPRIECR